VTTGHLSVVTSHNLDRLPLRIRFGEAVRGRPPTSEEQAEAARWDETLRDGLGDA
jgi:hypothetical protein